MKKSERRECLHYIDIVRLPVFTGKDKGATLIKFWLVVNINALKDF